jgi:hypothetical protein
LETQRYENLGEKVARIVKYIDSIGFSGTFGSVLETENSIPIHNGVYKYQVSLY